jgi:hypothetical protein
MTWIIYLNAVLLALAVVGMAIKYKEIHMPSHWARWSVVLTAPLIALPAAIVFLVVARIRGEKP